MVEREIALLRTLTALAWADGIVTPEESAMLDRAAVALGLPAHEREALIRLRREPVPLDRFEELARELRALVSSDEERRQVLAQARALVAADQIVAPEESRWLDLLERILRAGETPSLFARVRAVLAGARGEGGGIPAAPREELERRILGGLLARRVLRAGGVEDPAAFEAGVGRFLAATGLTPGEMDEVLATVQRNETRDDDRQRLCASVNRITDHEGRLEVLAALFAAGRQVRVDVRAAETELRLIANYLWIEPQEFVRVRSQAVGRALDGAPIDPGPVDGAPIVPGPVVVGPIDPGPVGGESAPGVVT
jgi:uncharacterized tellurite resistance protein B-like protein